MSCRIVAPVLFLALLAPILAGAGEIPHDALAAEGEGRWHDALAIYSELLEAEPGRADVWLRVADIHARLDAPERAAEAFAAAAAARPDDADLQLRLGRARGVAGRPGDALAAYRRATELAPDDAEAWRMRAEAASWLGETGEAAAGFRRLLQLRPLHLDARLGLARNLAWSGELDEAARHYATYLTAFPENPPVFLEAARVQTWRGAYGRALDLIERYEAFAGADAVSRSERAAVLARAGRPLDALPVLEERLSVHPDDPVARADYAIALKEADRWPAAHRQAERLVAEHGRERPEVRGAWLQVETPLRPAVEPRLSGYEDSDDLRRDEAGLGIALSPRPDVHLSLDARRGTVEAPLGSGLASFAGETRAEVEELRLGLSAQPSARVRIDAHVGRARTLEIVDEDETTPFGAALTFRLGDLGEVGVGFERFLWDLTPRTTALGLERDRTRIELALQPTIGSWVEALFAVDDLSDGNGRWEARLAPRWAVARGELVNVDLGLRAWWVGFDEDLTNGYFDPERSERFSLTSSSYWKLGEDVGLSVFLAGGVERTLGVPGLSEGWEPGGDGSLELTVGIYRDWMLRAAVSASTNQREATGAFEAASVRLGLTRRF